MKENRSENLEGDFFSFFYSALFSYLFFYSTVLVKEINHGLVAVNHKDGYQSEIEGDHWLWTSNAAPVAWFFWKKNDVSA